MADMHVPVENGPAAGKTVVVGVDDEGKPQATALIAMLDDHAYVMRGHADRIGNGVLWTVYERRQAEPRGDDGSEDDGDSGCNWVYVEM